MSAATANRPYAIIITDWSGFCALLDQERAEGAAPNSRIVRAQGQWLDLEPAPAPAFPALLQRGTGFNALQYSPALESWLSTWDIAHAVHHPDKPDGLVDAPMSRAA